MGLEINAKAEIPRGRLLKRRPGRDALWAGIREAIETLVDDSLSGRLLSFGTYQHSLYVGCHPAGQPVEFLWSPEGTVSVAVKTSTAGPGYHALVVELLDAVSHRCGLDWGLGASGENLDETDYARHRDFRRLQTAMAGFLRGLCRTFVEVGSGQSNPVAINMPLGYPTLRGDPTIVTPMGPFSLAWFQATAKADEPGLSAAAERFFPWWHEGRDAHFWLNCGLVMAWSQLPWHPPVSEEETAEYQLALDCFAKARQLNPELARPEREVQEIEDLLVQRPERPTPPPRDGIGFRRRQMCHRVTGAWTIELPGYYYQQTGEDEAECSFWFGDRAIHVCSLAVERNDGQPARPEELLPRKDPKALRHAEVIDFDAGHLKGWASIRRTEDAGERGWSLQGTVAAESSLCVVTISYKDPADREWAIAAYRSVHHPESEGPPDGTGRAGGPAPGGSA